MLRPRLNKAEMLMEGNDKEFGKHKFISVEIWSTVGLALHKDEKYKARWRISHYKSGRVVLKYIPTKELAIQYMVRLHKVADWNMVLPELRREQKRIEGEMKKMQKEIGK